MTSNSALFDGIYIFNEVVLTKSFSASAIKTGHSTSYISKEITKLEKRLGVRLLNRTTRSISLTAEGEIFHQHSKQLIDDAEYAMSLLNNKKDDPHGILKITCPTSFSRGYLQPILSEYILNYPQVELHLDLNDRRVDIIQEGIDVAIRATSQLDDSTLISRKIYECKALTLVSPKYIKKFGKPTHPNQLSAHNCICYSNIDTPTRWHYKDSIDKTIMVDVRQFILCNDSQMQIDMALDGHGICRLPEFCIPPHILDNDLEVLFTEYTSQRIDVFAVYPTRKYITPKVRRLIDLLVDKLSHL